MITFWQGAFWLSFLALLHTYLLYPVLIRSIAANRPLPDETTNAEATDFRVSVLVPVRNEISVIRDKLVSILASQYKQHNIEIIVGSDNSDDGTDDVVTEFALHNENVKLIRLDQRSGKSEVVNKLATAATGDIWIITDADALFQPDTIAELVKPFAQPDIGLVDSRIVDHPAGDDKTIPGAEASYISIDTGIKAAESRAFQCMMGPFGACFAIRAKLFQPIPKNWLVDDYYLNMLVLQNRYKSIINQDAEIRTAPARDVSNEFRRKVRIGAGNYQNLRRFLPLVLRFDSTSFCFVSHKVLRWLGPFFIIIAYSSSIALSRGTSSGTWFYRLYALLQSVGLLAPLIDRLLQNFGFRWSVASMANHFVLANLALLAGFGWFVSGIKSGVWEPTQRHRADGY